MPGELRFDGQVVIITGAGGVPPSLGSAYAHLFAERGAKVLVNDFGLGSDGRGGVEPSAQAVVDSIIAAGGEAIADTHSVADSASAQKIVQTAIDAWGRVDVLINNAGMTMYTLFDEISEEDIHRTLDSHLLGHIWMTRAAWPHMRKAGYGRVINVGSEAMFGSALCALHGTSKGGVYALTNNLAFEGGRYGIKTNMVSPAAITRKHAYLSGAADPEAYMKEYAAISRVEQIAPVVAYLAHESCELNGESLFAFGGKVTMYRMAETNGYTNPDLTPEDVAANIGKISDLSTLHEKEYIERGDLDKRERERRTYEA